MLAHAILAPGQLTRLEALRKKAADALELVLGAAVMLLMAAFIEAFWSSSGVPADVKYIIAGLLWLLVITYLGFAGALHRGSR